MVILMDTIKEAATEFLAAKRVAVTGVSRDAKGHGSNVVYQRLRQRGYEVFAVNPNAETVEGDTAYPDLKSIPGRHPQHVRSSAAAGELTVAIGGQASQSGEPAAHDASTLPPSGVRYGRSTTRRSLVPCSASV